MEQDRSNRPFRSLSQMSLQSPVFDVCIISRSSRRRPACERQVVQLIGLRHPRLHRLIPLHPSSSVACASSPLRSDPLQSSTSLQWPSVPCDSISYPTRVFLYHDRSLRARCSPYPLETRFLDVVELLAVAAVGLSRWGGVLLWPSPSPSASPETVERPSRYVDYLDYCREGAPVVLQNQNALLRSFPRLSHIGTKRCPQSATTRKS